MRAPRERAITIIIVINEVGRGRLGFPRRADVAHTVDGVDVVVVGPRRYVLSSAADEKQEREGGELLCCGNGPGDINKGRNQKPNDDC